jgi:putative transposase
LITFIHTTFTEQEKHPFVERLIKSIRNELLDRTLFWNSRDLQRKLDSYKQYFNQYRSHLSLNMVTPNQKLCDTKNKPVLTEKYRWDFFCRGLFQLPIAA